MKARLLSLLACIACGCSASRAEPVDPLAPDQALEEITTAFEELATAAHPELARQAWQRAHDAFARGLEHPIRSGCGEHRAMELEYGFGLLGAALPHDGPRGASTHDHLGRLARALEQSVGCL